MDRLFVPLMTQYFEDFRSNGKTYELRAYGRAYTEKHIYSGRKVELRKGYSGESQWGIVGDVVVGSLGDVIKQVQFQKISPRAKSKSEFFADIGLLYGNRPKYIAFEVKLDK